MTVQIPLRVQLTQLSHTLPSIHTPIPTSSTTRGLFFKYPPKYTPIALTFFTNRWFAGIRSIDPPEKPTTTNPVVKNTPMQPTGYDCRNEHSATTPRKTAHPSQPCQTPRHSHPDSHSLLPPTNALISCRNDGVANESITCTFPRGYFVLTNSSTYFFCSSPRTIHTVYVSLHSNPPLHSHSPHSTPTPPTPSRPPLHSPSPNHPSSSHHALSNPTPPYKS